MKITIDWIAVKSSRLSNLGGIQIYGKIANNCRNFAPEILEKFAEDFYFYNKKLARFQTFCSSHAPKITILFYNGIYKKVFTVLLSVWGLCLKEFASFCVAYWEESRKNN